MSETLKIRYKVGEIEFEAEGSAKDVEQQRVNFMSTVLPAAVDAMVQTHQATNTAQYIESSPSPAMLEAGSDTIPGEEKAVITGSLDRTSLAAFLNPYGQLTENDFTLFAAFFDEKKNGQKSFSIEELKQYYSEARRPLPKNPSMSLTNLAKKGRIMDAPAPSKEASVKYYTLTDNGLKYVESYVPKEKKCSGKTVQQKRTAKKAESVYASINADDLNLKKYPSVKTFKETKKQIILAIYIVTNEGKGEWFSVDDIIYLMKNIFELPCNRDKVHGVIQRNPSFFDDQKAENRAHVLQYKLLSGAKDFAESLIQKD